MDQESIAKARVGDLDAFGRILDHYHKFLMAVIMPIIRDPVAAEDVLQETFIQVYRSLPQYRDGSFKSWLARIATNKALDWKRAERRHPEETLLNGIEDSFEGDRTTEEEAVQREMSARLYSICNNLSEDYRRVFAAYYLDGKSYKELALMEGISIKTVESRLYRARKMIRANWEGG